jgi:hypothetical protein
MPVSSFPITSSFSPASFHHDRPNLHLLGSPATPLEPPPRKHVYGPNLTALRCPSHAPSRASRTASRAAAAAVPRGLPDPATAPTRGLLHRRGLVRHGARVASRPRPFPTQVQQQRLLGHQSHVHVCEEDDQGTRRVNYEFAIYCIISTV